MYVIMAYDVNEKRVNKVLKKAREYLNWIQNSLLEGEITGSKFRILKKQIEAIINPKEDSVKWYIIPNKKLLSTEALGVDKSSGGMFV